MAISKTQPMRSAEIDLIDAVNDNTTAIANLSSALTDEITAREGADTTLDNKIDGEITNRTNADSTLDDKINGEIAQRANSDTEIMNIIGTGFSSANTIASNIGDIQDSIGSGFSSANTIASNVQDLQGFDNRFRVGMTQAYTIAASGTQSVTVDLDYEQTDEIIVFVSPVGASESFTELTCALDSAGYAGFSATIENTDTVNSVTVAFGYIAIKVN